MRTSRGGRRSPASRSSSGRRCCSSCRSRRSGCCATASARLAVAVRARGAARASRRGRSVTSASTAASSLIASEGGVTFWTGNHPLARAKATSPRILRLKRRRARVPARASGPHARSSSSRSTTATRWPGSGASRRVAGAGGAEGVLSRSCRSGRRMRYTRRGIVPRRSSPYLLLLPFAIAGAWRLGGAGRPPAALWLAGRSAVLPASCSFRRSGSGFP